MALSFTERTYAILDVFEEEIAVLDMNLENILGLSAQSWYKAGMKNWKHLSQN